MIETVIQESDEREEEAEQEFFFPEGDEAAPPPEDDPEDQDQQQLVHNSELPNKIVHSAAHIPGSIESIALLSCIIKGTLLLY